MKASRSVRNFMLITSLTSVWALILGTVALTSVAAEEKDPGQMLPETSEIVSFAETSSGELARKLAGKMINKYPSLSQNPYAVLAKFTDNAPENDVQNLLNEINGSIVEHYPTSNWYLIETPMGALNAYDYLGASSMITEVAFDKTISLTTANTNDPLIGDVWGLNNIHGVDAETAWSVSSGADEVVVAVIDSGVDINHPDLSSIIWTNDNEIPNNGIDDDSNGFIDDVNGWDFTSEYDNTPQDEHGHGTHVSGTIAAIRNNSEGIAGVADNVKIMPLRFLDKDGFGVTSWAISALEYAVANGAQISNNSWGGGGFEPALYSAIAAAQQQNHLFVAAAGNSGQNSDTNPMYPAAYDLSNIISVAAINSNGGLAGFSNYGVNSVDIAAPGVSILSTMSEDSAACSSSPPCYTSWDGTSMAAPHVAGVAALILGLNNQLTPEDIITIILDNARSTIPLNGRVYSGGELDGGRAVVNSGSFGSITFNNYNPTELIYIGQTITLSATAIASDGSDISSTINWSDQQDQLLATGSSVTFTPTAVGNVSVTASTQDISGTEMKKTAWFTIVEPTLNFLSHDQFTSSAFGSEKLTSWVWGGDPNETTNIQAISVDRYFVESSPQNRYLLPDSAGPWNYEIAVTNANTIIDVIVGVRINHTWPGDLNIAITHPDGSNVLLADRNGWESARDGQEIWGEGSKSCSGELAYFSSFASQSISERNLPFTGFSLPLESLETFAGKNSNGNWVVQINDTALQDDGELFCIELIITSTNPVESIPLAQSYPLSSGSVDWAMADTVNYQGAFRVFLENTTLGTFVGPCCHLLNMPDIPSGLTLDSRSIDSVVISWNESAINDNSLVYVADLAQEKCPNNGVNCFNQTLDTCITLVATCTFSGLVSNQTYSVNLVAQTSSGKGDKAQLDIPTFEYAIFSQNTAGVRGGSEAGDAFGSSLAVGDLNGDGFEDLVVGVPGEAIGRLDGAGGVNILYGSAEGLSTAGDQFISQNTAGVRGGSEAGDAFGSSLAVGDLNGDGFEDLVVGVPGEAIGRLDGAGGVNILYGSAEGLSTAGDQFISQNTAGVRGGSEAGDAFGSSLAVGDLNGDGFEDLVVGVPGEAIGRLDGAGGVNILYGSAEGLSTAGDQFISQNTAGVRGGSEAGDAFGSSLAVGDLNGDGFEDLVVGVPGEAIGRLDGAGGVNILYGSAEGLSTAGDQFISQNTAGVRGGSEAGDAFGSSLAVGDLNGDGFEDLVVGVPGEAIGRLDGAGGVNILYGSAEGLSTAGDQFISQNTAGVRGGSEAGDAFGSFVEIVNSKSDEPPSLVITAPNESIGSVTLSGAIHILPTEVVDGTLEVSTEDDVILHLGQNPFATAFYKDALLGTAVVPIEGVLHVGAPGYAVNLESEAGAIFAITE